jgi:sulfide:quinone oxidoreductase
VSEQSTIRVAVVGGGIAGLETLLALRALAGERVEIVLVSPEPDFVYRPLIVDETLRGGVAEHRELEPIAESHSAEFIHGALAEVRPGDHALELDTGVEVPYDVAVICIGAVTGAAYSNAATLAHRGPVELDAELRRAADSESGRLAFLVPPSVSWPLPLYELALMAARRAGEQRLDVELEIVTPEPGPLAVFGPVASDAVAELLRSRRIGFRAGATAVDDDGAMHLMPGHERYEAGAAISVPTLSGPAVAGLPADEHGFIPVDEHSRVKGADDVYAAGDGTSFPIKQGGLATQQADAAAEHIAARAGADVEAKPFHPILRGKLITGEETLSMRADLTGGHGEAQVSQDYLWWPPQKVGGRYLAPYLAGVQPRGDLDPPEHGIDVEVSLPVE